MKRPEWRFWKGIERCLKQDLTRKPTIKFSILRWAPLAPSPSGNGDQLPAGTIGSRKNSVRDLHDFKVRLTWASQSWRERVAVASALPSPSKNKACNEKHIFFNMLVLGQGCVPTFFTNVNFVSHLWKIWLFSSVLMRKIHLFSSNCLWKLCFLINAIEKHDFSQMWFFCSHMWKMCEYILD